MSEPIPINRPKSNISALANQYPTAPAPSRNTKPKKPVSDPSAVAPTGRSYPIPSFFEYRAKPKEFDSL